MVTLDELKTYLGVEDASEDAKLLMILNGVIDLVRRYTGRRWEYGTFEEAVFFDEGLGFVKEIPVVNVISVVDEEGFEQEIDGWEKVTGLIELVEPYTGEAVVKYEGGETPSDIKLAVLRLAEYFWNRPSGVVSESINDVRLRYELSEVFDILDRYRRLFL